MDLASLWTTVRNRCLADTGAGGLFATETPLITGVFENVVPENQEGPIVVYDVESCTQRDAFRRAQYEVFIRFNVYVDQDPESSSAASATASAIINRLRGDWQDQSAGTAPTYGFHRWTAQTVGDWTVNSWSHRSSITAHTNTELHFVERYFALCQQAGA